MKKSKPKDKTFLKTNEKLVKMFEDQIPEDRQQVLRDIDSIMCNMLDRLKDAGMLDPSISVEAAAVT